MKAILRVSKILICLALLDSSRVLGSTLAVLNLNDSGPGSLRQAIAAAAPGDLIWFTVVGTISLTSSELLITNDLTVVGPGADKLAISGNDRWRVFQIGSNVTAQISGLTISDGQAPWGDYGSHYCDFAAATGTNGGGVLNFGVLTLLDCTVATNRAGAGVQIYCNGGMWAGEGGGGGGIFNANVLVASGCTFSGNAAGGGASGGTYYDVQFNPHPTPGADGGSGGAIFNSGILCLTNCTLSANAAGAGGDGTTTIYYYHGYSFHEGSTGGSGGSGGGIFNSGVVNIMACTFGTNSIGDAGSNVGSYGNFGRAGRGQAIRSATPASSVQLFSTLLASDLAGAFTSLGHNLVSWGYLGSGFTNGVSSDLVGTIDSPLDALLGPLQDNGGPTPTMALLPGSPAIDNGKTIPGLVTDQRGRCFSRVCNTSNTANAAAGDGSDIGAFEVQQGECGPANRVANLIAALQALDLPKGIANSLSGKLDAAADALTRGDNQGACHRLQKIAEELEARADKRLLPEQGDFLKAELGCIRTVLGCQ